LILSDEERKRNQREQMRKYHLKPKDTGIQKKEFEKIYERLGSKCVSCGEKYNPSLKKTNLHIHHKFYSKDKEYLKKYGTMPQKYEALRMIKANKIRELKKKYTLLCQQCNTIDGWVRKNPDNAFETLCWLYSEGYFDEALKDDLKFKKLTEFMKD
jgi:hypothetical protein